MLGEENKTDDDGKFLVHESILEEELKKNTAPAEDEETWTASVEELQKQTEAEMSNPYNTSLSQFLALEQAKMSEEQKAEHEKEVQRRLVCRTLSEELGTSTETADEYPTTNTTSESEGKEPMTASPTVNGEFEFTMDEDEDYDDAILINSPQQKADPLTPPFRPQAVKDKICFLVDSDDEEEYPESAVEEPEEIKTVDEGACEETPEEEEVKLPAAEEEKKQEPTPESEQEPNFEQK